MTPTLTNRKQNGYRREAEDVLDGMTVTDREYHHQNLDVPLVAELLRRADAQGMLTGRALLVGGNALLANALLSRSVGLDIWRFRESHLESELQTRVTEVVDAESVAGCETPGAAYDLIVAPMVLEGIADARGFLRNLRKRLSPEGVLLVATRNQSRLVNRLAALRGRPMERRGQTSLSFSWPSLPVVREYHCDELAQLAREAGLTVRRLSAVAARRPMLELEVLPIEGYVARKAGQLFSSIVPNANDVLLLEASRRPGDDAPVTGLEPAVTVGLSVIDGGAPLRRALVSLRSQTYPAEKTEIVVLHDGRQPGVLEAVEEARAATKVSLRTLVSPRSEGPAARNLLLRASDAGIVATTDDCSLIPADWVESGVRRLDEDSAIAGGPVYAAAKSIPAYLDVPGLRPDVGERQPRRTDLFPIYNAFYRREVVLAAGGFDETYESAAGIAKGWDTELAWRLQRLGWRASFREELGFARRFPENGGLAAQTRLGEELPAFYSQVPELKPTLVAGLFASRSTMYFDVALAGLLAAVGRRNPAWLLLGLPWAGQLSKRMGITPRRWPGSLKVIARINLTHAAWLVGLLKGSIKARWPVL